MLPVSADTLVNIILAASCIVFALFNWLLKPSLKARILTIAALCPLSIAIYALPRLFGSGINGFMDDMTNVLAWIASFVYATFFTVAASAALWIFCMCHRWYTIGMGSTQKDEVIESNKRGHLSDSSSYQPPPA